MPSHIFCRVSATIPSFNTFCGTFFLFVFSSTHLLSLQVGHVSLDSFPFQNIQQSFSQAWMDWYPNPIFLIFFLASQYEIGILFSFGYETLRSSKSWSNELSVHLLITLICNNFYRKFKEDMQLELGYNLVLSSLSNASQSESTPLLPSSKNIFICILLCNNVINCIKHLIFC